MTYANDEQLRWALEHTVVLKQTDVPPCQWPLNLPCRNLGLGPTPDGRFLLCLPHMNIYARDPVGVK